ncbi:alpha/beta hydrolase [Amycolatopsis sp. CA-128772]|uniref:alpha/beta hydrolase n=1 Tax=Amycolatopsis sp. CA-128772 TaxID=2073159 RepID=UPI000CD2A59B|nr:alpha/beta hydrolase [Amycolatopsis sp. CA-128772]
MSEETTLPRPAEPDWLAMTAEELIAYREAENRFRASAAARAFTGEPDPGAVIEWRELALPGRDLPVRVYRPTDHDGPALPLVVHVHGGGFVGTAVQSDWVNSHLAARLPAVVVSVEHRLVDPDHPVADAVDDGWDALRHLVRDAGPWGIDPAQAAVFGESCGGLISALAAIRAREAGLPLRAQVLVNPATELTATMLEHGSAAEHAHTPTLSVPVLRLFQRLAVPPGTDARTLSPLHAGDLGGLAPALVVVPTHDPLADHGRRYAERLDAAGTPARLTEHGGAGHAFLSMPGVAPQAEAARAEILAFLRTSFAA